MTCHDLVLFLMQPRIIDFFFPSQRHITGSYPTSWAEGPLGCLLQSCFAALWLPACTGAWGCFFRGAGLDISLYWTSCSSCWPVYPLCHIPLRGNRTICSISPPVHLQISWRCTLPHHPVLKQDAKKELSQHWSLHHTSSSWISPSWSHQSPAFHSTSVDFSSA